MTEKFDPYHAWLEIPPAEQPPDHYRLLGLRRLETSPAVIEAAADERMGLLHAYQKGEHAAECAKLIEEIAAARACLLNPNRKAGYDRGLHQQQAAGGVGSPPGRPAPQPGAAEFLSILEQKDLLPANVLKGLRSQLAQARKPVAAAVLAKRLIEQGYLTPALAKRLLVSAAEEEPSPPAPAPAEAKPKSKEEELGLAPLEREDVLGLAPLEETPAAPKAKPQAAGKAKSAKPQSPQRAQPQAAETARPRAGGSLLDEELAPLAGPGAAGPLDGLLADAGLTADAGSPLIPLAPRRKGWRRFFPGSQKAAKKSEGWDSSLMLVGGGSLLALVILGGVLFWALTRQSSDEALRLADKDYHDGSYSQAIHKYDLFLEKYPKHSGAGLARVNRGLAQLRQVTAKGTSNWSTALEQTKEVLGQIAPETEFKQAHADLASILLAVAEGLTAQAQTQTDAKLVAEARETVALMDKYVPKSLQRGVKLAEIDATLMVVQRAINRDKDLQQAVAAMQQAVTQGKTEEAYALRKTLLKQYPDLAANEQLESVLREVSRARQAAVEVVRRPQPAETGQPAAPALPALTLARRSVKTNAPGAEGQMVFAAAAGAAYGLDAANGRVLWRRFVGFESNVQGPGFPPLPISLGPASDALLVDRTRDEILRVEAATGRLRWRQALGEPFDAQPVVAIGKILVATRSGRLVTIELASGDAPGYVKFPQPLRVAPAVDFQRGLIFLPAHHSDLYVLSLADGACRQVVYLGHEPGSITAPPAVLGRLLLLAVNDRTTDSTLHVLSIDSGQEGLSVKPVQQQRLKGHVDTAPACDGRKAVVATDLGAVYVFEPSGAEVGSPLRKAAETTAAGQGRLIRYALVQGGQTWIADDRLTAYDIQAARARLVPKWMSDEQSVFLQPLVAIERTIFHVRRQAGVPGLLVAAGEMEEPNRLWETHLATPLAAEPLLDANGGPITLVTAAGELFQIGAGEISAGGVSDEPLVVADTAQLSRPVVAVIRFGGGLTVLSSGEGSKQIAVLNTQGQVKRCRWLVLPDELACPPVAMAEGLLAPTKAGPVLLLDPRSGSKLAEPFLPRLEPGMQVAWRPPAVTGDNQAILADAQGKVYRLSIVDQPKPHLAAAAEVQLSSPVVAPLAALDKVAYAVDADGVLAALELPELKRIGQWPLPGRVAWGPRRVGDRVVLATDDGQLFCLDGGGKLVWQAPMPYGPLAGSPLPAGESLLLAAQGGMVWRVEAATGKELAHLETGQPLGTGPVLMGSQLLLGGHDGCLLVVKQP